MILTRPGTFLTANPFSINYSLTDLHNRQTSRKTFADFSKSDLEKLASTLNFMRSTFPALRIWQLDGSAIQPLYQEASTYVWNQPDYVSELRNWLRLDPKNPRYSQDGLNRECLELNEFEAKTLEVSISKYAYPWLQKVGVGNMLGKSEAAIISPQSHILSIGLAIYKPEDLIFAGQTLLSLWLELSKSGFYTHPLSQILDAPQTSQKLHNIFKTEKQIFSIFRVGKSKKPAQSPRVVCGSFN